MEDAWYNITDSFDKDDAVDEWHGLFCVVAQNAFIRDDHDKILRTCFINI